MTHTKWISRVSLLLAVCALLLAVPSLLEAQAVRTNAGFRSQSLAANDDDVLLIRGLAETACVHECSQNARRRGELVLARLLDLTLMSLGFSLYLAHIEKEVLGVWCIYCVISLGIIALMSLLTIGASIGQWMHGPRPGY